MRRFTVRVTTHSSQNVVREVSEDVLQVRLQAKPIDGQANRHLVRVLADYFHVKLSAVRIITGRRSRIKIIEVH